MQRQQKATTRIDPKIDQKLACAIAANQCGIGSPTRARTWDLRINSPSISYVISLHHQLLTASAQLRHRSRMQCNAGVRKTVQLHFRIHLAVEQSMPSVGVARSAWLRKRELSVPYEDRNPHIFQPHQHCATDSQSVGRWFDSTQQHHHRQLWTCSRGRLREQCAMAI